MSSAGGDECQLDRLQVAREKDDIGCCVEVCAVVDLLLPPDALNERHTIGQSQLKQAVDYLLADSCVLRSWLNDAITIEESVAALEKNDDLEKGFAELLLKAKEKIKL
jgi:hypothetical protein